jgi:hypothetical protein
MEILKLFFILLKDIYKTFSLAKCDIFDIIEIIGFGLIINSLYGILKLNDMTDWYLLLLSLYGTLKAKHFKEKKC